jgi:hypothetical protein
VPKEVGYVSALEDHVENGEQPAVPHLVLELEGDRQTFPAYAQANQFLLVKYADDLALGGLPTVRATTKLVVGQVLKEHRPRLEEYLEEHGADDTYGDHLFAALQSCWSGETMLPLAPSSPSSGRTATEPTA